MLPAATGLSPGLVFRWRQLMNEGGKEAVRADDQVVAASELRRLEERVRELERLLGRKTMEVGILKKALDLARAKNRSCCRTRRVWAISGEDRQHHARRARSDVVERREGKRPRRGAQERAADIELTGTIRRPTGTSGSPRY
jgi:hypothetical protein